MDLFRLDRPLNFAHRGASYRAPANTLAAFLLAADLGADGIELDIQLSRDGKVVVIHDFVLEGTTNGQGLVRDSTLAEMKQLDAGSWFDPAFRGQRIPTLQEVIDAVGHRLLLNIEIKTKRIHDDGLAAAVVRAIQDSDLLGRVVVSSFNPWAIRWVKRYDPRIPTGLLYGPGQALALGGVWLRHLTRCDALHPHWTLVSGQYVRWARTRGYGVHTWTVDEPHQMEQLIRWGVDLIITNRPGLLSQVLLSSRGR